MAACARNPNFRKEALVIWNSEFETESPCLSCAVKMYRFSELEGALVRPLEGNDFVCLRRQLIPRGRTE